MKKIILYFGFGIGLIVLIWFVFYLILPVRLTDISPPNNNQETPTDTTIVLTFNKKVWLNNFSISATPELPAFSVKKNRRQLTFTFKETLELNTLYQFRLDSNKYFIYNNQKIKSTLWQFTTGTGTVDEINDMNFGDFFEKNPLALWTPFENEHFRIDWPDEQGMTPITLYATFNAGVNGPPIEEQEKAYKEELKTYKQEALNWIKSKGIDPKNLKINWLPEEAGQLP